MTFAYKLEQIGRQPRRSADLQGVSPELAACLRVRRHERTLRQGVVRENMNLERELGMLPRHCDDNGRCCAVD